MPILINCDNKGCLQSQCAELDTKTYDVICIKCGHSIKNISPFIKNQLKFFGQTIKNKKERESFSVKCEHCSFVGRPSLKENNIICSSCKKQLNGLSSTFKDILKKFLKLNESK